MHGVFRYFAVYLGTFFTKTVFTKTGPTSQTIIKTMTNEDPECVLFRFFIVIIQIRRVVAKEITKTIITSLF